MLKPVLIDDLPAGFTADLGGATVFFGTRFAGREILEKRFGAAIRFIKQVHGDHLVSTPPATEETEADAHWTAEAGAALAVYTADCLPVMIYCRKTRRVAAVHAGWRGVKSRVVMKTKSFFLDSGSTPQSLFAAVGPHIGPESFEIEKPLAEEILKSDPLGRARALPHAEPGKCYLDLAEIVKNQLSEIPPERILISEQDTYSSDLYFSYRRQKGAGRLISFIIRK